jgi:hypothetical protein
MESNFYILPNNFSFSIYFGNQDFGFIQRTAAFIDCFDNFFGLLLVRKERFHHGLFQETTK